mmetsp:Transcript_40003/g.89673  ORF Transcript_40003/g.89673 Transcript_40003/m.89673 type:complete len:503 (-) Transcript_40003:25-1533(-)
MDPSMQPMLPSSGLLGHRKKVANPQQIGSNKSLEFLLSHAAVTARPPPKKEPTEDLNALVSELRSMLSAAQRRGDAAEEALAEERRRNEHSLANLKRTLRGELDEERSMWEEEFNSIVAKERDSREAEMGRLEVRLDTARLEAEQAQEYASVEASTFEHRSSRLERCVDAMETRIRRLSAMEVEEGVAEEKILEATDNARKWQREASDLRLTVHALEDRCVRQDQQNAKMRTEVATTRVMGNGYSSQGTGSNRPPMPAPRLSHMAQKAPMVRPSRGRGSGAIAALARVVEDEDYPAPVQEPAATAPEEAGAAPSNDPLEAGGCGVKACAWSTGGAVGMSRNSSTTLSEASTLLDPFSVAHRVDMMQGMENVFHMLGLGTAVSSTATLPPAEQTACLSDTSTVLDGFDVARGLRAVASTGSIQSPLGSPSAAPKAPPITAAGAGSVAARFVARPTSATNTVDASKQAGGKSRAATTVPAGSELAATAEGTRRRRPASAGPRRN